MIKRTRAAANRPARFDWLGDGAVTLRLDATTSRATSERVFALMARIEAERFPGVVDIVPAYTTVTVVFDEDAQPERAAVEAVLTTLMDEATTQSSPLRTRQLVVPVAYGGNEGPDLASFAARVGLAPEEVVARHLAPEYVVGMLGFLPGFPYLIGLDPALALPRRDTPRARVPGGSVAIGGAQTGIYPFDAPGGWHLIGRTALRLFDATRAEPALLRPGDRLRFRAVAPELLATTALELGDA
jgi:KipI family sensor histidine kinase inhibitor